jgi:hypothetical protein
VRSMQHVMRMTKSRQVGEINTGPNALREFACTQR